MQHTIPNPHTSHRKGLQPNVLPKEEKLIFAQCIKPSIQSHFSFNHLSVHSRLATESVQPVKCLSIILNKKDKTKESLSYGCFPFVLNISVSAIKIISFANCLSLTVTRDKHLHNLYHCCMGENNLSWHRFSVHHQSDPNLYHPCKISSLLNLLLYLMDSYNLKLQAGLPECHRRGGEVQFIR